VSRTRAKAKAKRAETEEGNAPHEKPEPVDYGLERRGLGPRVVKGGPFSMRVVEPGVTLVTGTLPTPLPLQPLFNLEVVRETPQLDATDCGESQTAPRLNSAPPAGFPAEGPHTS
jgi:hypothetical protein